MLNFVKGKYTNLTKDAKFSEILIGSAWAFSAHLLTAGLGFISSIIIARFYGAAVLGIVAVIQSVLILTTMFSVLGINTSILRLIPEHLVKYSPSSAFKLYRKTQYLVMGGSLIIGALLFLNSDIIADKVFSKPYLAYYFSLAAAFVVFRSMMVLSTQAVRGLSLARMFAFMQVLFPCFNLILLILLTIFLGSEGVPVYALLGGFALTSIVGWLVMESSFKERIQPQDLVEPIPVREILSISLPMLVTATMTFVIDEAGVILLGIFRSQAEVGYYVIAVKLATLTTIILLAINAMAAPKFSELFHSGNIDALFHVAKKSAKLIFWTTTPMLVGFVILGRPVLNIIFGHEFVIAYPSLLLLVLGQFVQSISGSTEFFMNMTGNQNAFRNIMLFSAIINMGLNVWLIPEIGISGAALAAMVGLGFWNIATLLYIKSKFGETTGYLPGLSHL